MNALPGSAPYFSLIIPAYNEEAYLPILLDSVAIARDRYEGVPDDSVHDSIEVTAVPEHVVGRPLALPQGPGVAEIGPEGGDERREADGHEIVEQGAPVRGQLLVEERLHGVEVVDLQDLVAAALKADTSLLELPGEPLATVHGDLDLVRKPGLDADAHETVVGVIQI